MHDYLSYCCHFPEIPYNLLSTDKILDRSELKAFADDKIIVTKRLKFGMRKGGKHCGKRRKCWLPAFSPFPTMFSEGYLLSVIKRRDCVVKGYPLRDSNILD